MTLSPGRQLVAFSLIGGAGFLIEAAVLTALVTHHDWGLYSARAVSFPLAVTCTWLCNRRFTFRVATAPAGTRGYILYLATQSFGALLNLGIYSLTVVTISYSKSIPIIPLAAGSAVALAFNFLAARHVVFREVKPDESP